MRADSHSVAGRSHCGVVVRGRGPAWTTLLACTLVLGTGCERAPSGRAGEGTAEAPVLVTVDSITLAENDSAYVAEPNDLAVGPDGAFYVADRFAKTVHVIGRDGRFRPSIGRSGQGPGEFANPGFLAFDGDSVLYVVDSSEVETFDLRTRAHLGSYPVRTRPGLIAASSGRLFAGYADSAQGGTIARITRDGSGPRVTGPFPFTEFMTTPGLFSMINSVALAMRGDTSATAYTVTNHVYLSDAGGRVLDSIWVPARRRNGARPDLLRRLADNPGDQELGMAAIYGASAPMDLHWMPGGRIALVSTDWTMVDNRFIDSSYVSVVDPRERRSCVDARIPGPTDPPVSVGLRGDTLFVLSQQIDGETRISTTIHAYRIDTDACRWVTR